MDKDGNVSPDWEYLDFDPNDRQPGDMITTNSFGHIDMYVFTDTNGNARGFNAGSGADFGCGDSVGHGIQDSVKLAKYYLENGNKLPENDGTIGAWTIQDGSGPHDAGSSAKVIRYKGSGSGRGKGNNSKVTSSNVISKYKSSGIKGCTSDMPFSIQNRINRLNKEMNSNTGRGSILKSFDEVKSNVSNKSLFGNNQTTKSSITTSSSNYNSSNSSSSNAFSTTGNNSIDLNQLINLINIIANNSDKIDAIVQLLATIATNTENTSTAITKGNNKSPTAKNNLSALRSALDSNNSGMDIVKAVYQIAQS